MSDPNVISELESAWVQLRGDPQTVRVFEGLREAEPALRRLVDLDDLEAAMAARSCVADLDRHDEVLCALLRQAQIRGCAGDLAARITLQVLLPGLKGLCRHPFLASLTPDERREVLAAALWEEIRAPRSVWKPFKVSAQVLGRTRGRLRPARGFAATVSVASFGDEVPPEVADRCYPDASEQQSSHAGVELLHVLADAVADGRMDRDQGCLIARVQVMGESIEEVAERMGISPVAAARRLYRAQEALVTALCRPVPEAVAADRGRRRGVGGGPVPK